MPSTNCTAVGAVVATAGPAHEVANAMLTLPGNIVPAGKPVPLTYTMLTPASPELGTVAVVSVTPAGACGRLAALGNALAAAAAAGWNSARNCGAKFAAAFACGAGAPAACTTPLQSPPGNSSKLSSRLSVMRTASTIATRVRRFMNSYPQNENTATPSCRHP